MLRPACIIERVNLQPAVIKREARCPDDRGDSSLRQIQLKNGIGHVLRVQFDIELGN